VVEVSDGVIGNPTRETPLIGSARSLEDAQRAHILAVLEETDWVIEGPGAAAAILDLAPSTLRSKMNKLRIAREG
jgi:transcriptional regulator with GAF, ATPase, and Fis domain